MIIIDLDEKLRPSFQLIFYAKKAEFLPTCLKYKNKEFTQFENYGNKFRTRIFFANVEETKLEFMNSEKVHNYNFNNNNTYQALFRISDFMKFEISLTNMNIYFDNENILMRGEKIELLKNEFETLEKMLKEFYDKYEKYMKLNSYLIKEKNIANSELKKYSDEIVSCESYDFIKNQDIYKYNNSEEKILNLFHLDYFLNQYIVLSEEN